jgi:alpha-glucuronidase
MIALPNRVVSFYITMPHAVDSAHYGPAPWQDSQGRPDWNPTYFHGADSQGIGFDRTTLGSDAVSQYQPPLAAMFNDVQRTPEKYLLRSHRQHFQSRRDSATIETQ